MNDDNAVNDAVSDADSETPPMEPTETQPTETEPEAEPQSNTWTGKTHQNLKVVLTEMQVLAHGREQAKLLQSLARTEEEEKQVKAQYKAKKEKLLAEIKFESQIVNNGYIFKEIECEVRFNSPLNGEKTIVRLDTGDVVGIEMMDYHEMRRPVTQHELFPQNEVAAATDVSDESEEVEGDEEADQETNQKDSTAEIFPVNGATPNGYHFEKDLPPVPELPQMMDEANDNAHGSLSVDSPEATSKKRSRKAASA